jgi:hypothetical protein
MRARNPAFPFRAPRDRSDDWQTPPYALRPLVPYLKRDWLIWECSAGKGNLVRSLRDRGHHLVYASDIKNGRSFLKLPRHGPKRDEMLWAIAAYDCIVTNPPYSLKLEFLTRAYELRKPFAFLMPLFTFEGPSRQRLFRENGVEVIILDRRVEFEPPRGQNPIGFSTAWFTWGLKIGKTLTFAEIGPK